MSLGSATQHQDEVAVQEGFVFIKPFEKGIPPHFALRFRQVGQEDGAVTQKKSMLAAFNSPFWPFVLTSTSIPQEGLDFRLVALGRALESAGEPSRYGAARRAGASL